MFVRVGAVVEPAAGPPAGAGIDLNQCVQGVQTA